MKYTREQAQNVMMDLRKYLGHGDSFARLDKNFLNEKFPTLPKTGLLVNIKDGSIVFRTGGASGYGFGYNKEFEKIDSWNFEVKPNNWRKATPEDEAKWLKLCEKHLVKIGFKKGIEFKSAFGSDPYHFNGISSFRGGDIQSLINKGGGSLMNKGKWATPIKDTNQDELDKAVKNMMRLAKASGVEITLIIDSKK